MTTVDEKWMLPDFDGAKKSIGFHLSPILHLFLTRKKKPSTVTMEDIFEGAVGIDLGTTYS